MMILCAVCVICVRNKLIFNEHLVFGFLMDYNIRDMITSYYNFKD